MVALAHLRGCCLETHWLHCELGGQWQGNASSSFAMSVSLWEENCGGFLITSCKYLGGTGGNMDRKGHSHGSMGSPLDQELEEGLQSEEGF